MQHGLFLTFLLAIAWRFSCAASPAAPSSAAPTTRIQAATWKTERQMEKLQAGALRQGRAFRFAVLGDSRAEGRWYLMNVYPPKNSERIFRTLLAEMRTLNLDFSLHAGDIVIRGLSGEYEGLLKILDLKVTWPFFTTIGKHELVKRNGKRLTVEYENAFGPTDYYFDFRGFRFIALSIETAPTTGHRSPPTKTCPLLDSSRGKPSAYPMGNVAIREGRRVLNVAP